MQIDLGAPWLIAFFLVLARALAWMSVVTPFSNRSSVPRVVTIGIGAGLAMLVAPQLERAPVPTGTAELVGALVLQIGTGLALGFVVQMLLSAVAAAGTLLDLAGGLTLPPSMDPLSGAQLPIMSQFYEQVVVLVLFTSNGYLLMVAGFVRSFGAPGLGLRVSGIAASVVLSDLEVFFTSAIEIAAPVMVVLFAAQMVLALLSKAAPSTNVWLLGFPLQVFLVLVLVAITLTAVPDDVANLLARGLGDGLRMFGRA